MKYLDLTGLGEVWANIKSYISSKIPTKTSQLQNDSNYVTTSQLPSKTSQLTNDSDFTTNAKLATKQDTISDLVTIRSGASKGATAVQPSVLNNYLPLTGGFITGNIAVNSTSGGWIHGFDWLYNNERYAYIHPHIDEASGEKTLAIQADTDVKIFSNNLTFNGKQLAYADDLALKANIADTVLKTNTDYTFRNYSLNSLNFDEKYNENYVVGISEDGYGTRPVSGWTNIINFCTYHFMTQLCIPIHPNKDTDCMYIRTRWANDTTWGEWRKSANDNDVVHKSGYETISGIKNFNDVVLGEQSGVIRIGNNGEGALFCNLYYDGGIYNNIKLFYPKTDNEYNLGTSTNKWANVYATTFNGNSVLCTYDNAFMAQNGGYTFLIRNDGSITYFLMSDKDGIPGTWSTARPLIINNATGVCSINGNANTATSANDPNAVHKTGNEVINGDKTFSNLIQAQNSLIVQNTDPNKFTDIGHGWIEMSSPGYSGIDFKHAGNQDYLGRIAFHPDNILYLETINGAPIWANGKNIVRSVNGVNADNNGNVSIQGFSNGIGEIIQGYYVPNGIVQKSGSVYFGTLVRPNIGTTLNDSRDINITITDEFHPEAGKVYDYSQIFSTLYLHSYDSEYAVGATFDCGSNPKVDKWFGGWIKVAGSNLVRNSGRYLCTSVSPYGYAVTLRYNLTMTSTMSSVPGTTIPSYGCKIVGKSVPQNQMTVTSKATFMRVG